MIVRPDDASVVCPEPSLAADSGKMQKTIIDATTTANCLMTSNKQQQPPFCSNINHEQLTVVYE